MRYLPQDVKGHRSTAVLFLALWAALWLATVVTWLYAPTGESIGMHPVVFMIHLAAPLIAGGVAGWWQPAPRLGFRIGLIVGALFAAANMAVLLAWSAALIAVGRVTAEAQTMSLAEGMFEVLHMGLAYVLVGGCFGVLGGLLGAGLASVFRRSPGGQSPGSRAAAE